MKKPTRLDIDVVSGTLPLDWTVSASRGNGQPLVITASLTKTHEKKIRTKLADSMASLEHLGYRVTCDVDEKTKRYLVNVSLPSTWVTCAIAGCTAAQIGDAPPSWFKLAGDPPAFYCDKHASTGRRIARTILGPLQPANGGEQAAMPWAGEQPANLPLAIQRTGKLPPPHPACAVFPMMETHELEQTAASIKADGLLHAIEVWVDENGKEWLLDGRNRGRACELAGVTPRFERFVGTPKAARERVWALNVLRRHLDESQRSIAGGKFANLAHGGDRSRPAADEKVTQAQAAKDFNVSERSVRSAKRVLEKAVPEVVALVEKGKLPVSVAEKVSQLPVAKQREFTKAAEKNAGVMKPSKVVARIRQDERNATITKINTRPHPMPRGPFGLIVADVPWPYEELDGRAGIDYPPMSIADIRRLGEVIAPIAADDSILLFWTTNAFMPDVRDILTAWSFEWRTLVTWKKVTKNGKPKVGLGSWPRGETEHFVVASRGKPVHTLNETTTLFEGVVREKSRKPEEFFTLYADRCAGPRLELFAREARPGWQCWGAEVDKFTRRAA